MATRRVLITGFEPYGDWSSNPSADVAQKLDGADTQTMQIVSAVLPVVLANLRQHLEALSRAHEPDIVLCLGLHPGCSTLRVERVGLNVADSTRPDNAGKFLNNAAVVAEAPLALAATVPVHAIVDAQVAAGVPAVVSNSAGTYLCNASLFQCLHLADEAWTETTCGFIHLPFLPAQVASLMSGATDPASGAGPGQDAIASMHLSDMCTGVMIAAETAVQHHARAVASTS